MPQSHPSPMHHVWSWCWQSTKREMLSLRCLGGLLLGQGAVARDVICPLSKDILRMVVNWVTSLWKQNASLLPEIATKWWQSCPAHHIPTFRDTFFFSLCVDQLSVREHLRKQTYDYKILTHNCRTSSPWWVGHTMTFGLWGNSTAWQDMEQNRTQKEQKQKKGPESH